MSRRQVDKSGRYTPPKPKVPIEVTAREKDEFWEDYRVISRNLRRRCADLLPGDPPSDAEWQNAALMDMDGQDASDAELVAYWALHRAAIELGADELPDLRYATDQLALGHDPAEQFTREWNEAED
jgi:hypothetical protein